MLHRTALRAGLPREAEGAAHTDPDLQPDLNPPWIGEAHPLRQELGGHRHPEASPLSATLELALPPCLCHHGMLKRPHHDVLGCIGAIWGGHLPPKSVCDSQLPRSNYKKWGPHTPSTLTSSSPLGHTPGIPRASGPEGVAPIPCLSHLPRTQVPKPDAWPARAEAGRDPEARLGQEPGLNHNLTLAPTSTLNRHITSTLISLLQIQLKFTSSPTCGPGFLPDDPRPALLC